MALVVQEEKEGVKYSIVFPNVIDIPTSFELVFYRFQQNANKYMKSFRGLFILCLFVNSVTLLQLLQAFILSIVIWSVAIILYPADNEEEVIQLTLRRRKMKDTVKSLRCAFGKENNARIKKHNSVESPV